jgi:exonuclease SbcD
MRILHTADWHLGDRLGRIDRTADLRRAVARIGSYCEAEKVDVLLVAGDLFSELSRPDTLRDSIAHLQQVFLPFLRRGGTFLAITGNHDNESFCQTLCHAMTLAAPLSAQAGTVLLSGRVHLAAGPSFVQLLDTDGQPVQFLLMPYPTPSRYLDAQAQRYRGVEEKNRALRTAFTNQLRQLQSHPDFSPSRPTVLAGHIHVQGARLANPFRISERESIIFPETELPAEYAYVALGHIHQPQSLLGTRHVRYSGSIERLDMGERQDEKGVVLVDIGPDGRQGEPVCLPLPATSLYDVSINHPRVELSQLRERYLDAEQALVRYHVTYEAGTDNLEEILRDLDSIFPRWYDRDWCEAGALSDVRMDLESRPTHASFHDTVYRYLEAELAEHPDQEVLLALADDLLAEEPE